MKKLISILLITFLTLHAQDFTKETKAEHDARMQWWRDARFGLFIHWGLYSVPAGVWGDKTDYGEWIRTSAQIPLEEYDKFISQFNPVKFNAEEWVKMAKDAGMKYIVITSKHHDGFQLFNSQQSTYNVMSTPFKRDILKELSDACHKYGMKICWYYSIMDWHHPDYLPRRDWEITRSSQSANFERYLEYMKAQLKELLSNYGDISVLWFDGEWESTWNTKYGLELYNFVRSLQPNIIINNRVGAGRSGMEGFTKDGKFSGDFGTPEQTIPATGLPGVDWETCMTMNDHWGYNKNDNNWKSSKEILQMLTDIVSKGGNYLLNIGPTAEGVFPQQSIERLNDIGKWMKVNSESIYETKASPFKNLDFGRCTINMIEKDTRLYLHVFNWPINGKLILPGIYNFPIQAYLLSDPKKTLLKVIRDEDALILKVPAVPPDSINSVIVLDVFGGVDVSNPPTIERDFNIFVDSLNVNVKSDRDNVQIRYTLDGTQPNITSPIVNGTINLTGTTTLTARCFRKDVPVSSFSSSAFIKVNVKPDLKNYNLEKGISYKYFEGTWDKLPDFSLLGSIKEGTVPNFDLSVRQQSEYFGIEFIGYIQITKDDVYAFYTDSDDGSQLFIDNDLVVNNDELHGAVQNKGVIALGKGFHSIRLKYFNKTGGLELKVYFQSPSLKKQEIPSSILYHGL